MEAEVNRHEFTSGHLFGSIGSVGRSIKRFAMKPTERGERIDHPLGKDMEGTKTWVPLQIRSFLTCSH